MEKELETDVKDFLDTSLDIKDSKVRFNITTKLQEIKKIAEKMGQLKNMVDEKNLQILLINQNIERLQIKVDALKNDVAIEAKELEKVEV